MGVYIPGYLGAGRRTFKYQSGLYSIFISIWWIFKIQHRNEIFEQSLNINLVDIHYSIFISIWWIFDIQMLKSPRVTFKFKAKNDFFTEILNIKYQSGGYLIFNIEY